MNEAGNEDAQAKGEQQPQPTAQQGGEENQQENEDFCDFTVYVNRPGKTESLVFECSSFSSEVVF